MRKALYRVSTEYGHSSKFIYFVVPKTGSRSIFNAFNFKPEPFKFYDPELYKDYFTWAIVRNPWDRAVSAYTQKASKGYGPWRRYKTLSFSDFILNKREIKDRHTNIQSNQIPPDIDFVGRFENLQEDFNTICDKIGIPKQQLRRKNKSKHKHYTKYYNEETKQIVAEKYADDIKNFGYAFGD